MCIYYESLLSAIEDVLSLNVLSAMSSEDDKNWKNVQVLGAVHMSRASPANRADLSHENLYFSTK